MTFSKIVIALLLFLPSCLTSNKYYCISNEDVKYISDCQSPNYRGMSQITDFSQATPPKSAKRIFLYLAGGVHFIAKDLRFVKKLVVSITGISNVAPSTISCNNTFGIKFNISSTVNIENVNFLQCSTLHFERTNYFLDNVKVSDSDGTGLLAIDCVSHVINNCVFDGNQMGNIYLNFPNHRAYTLHIENTSITNGRGCGLQLYIQKTYQCNVSISHCKFHSNNARNGSHLFVQANGTGSIHILNSTFSKAQNCHGAFGVYVGSYNNQLSATIDNSEFSTSGCGAISVRGTRLLSMRNCILKHNEQTGFCIDSLKEAHIVNTTFQNNSRALYVKKYSWQILNISQCNFTYNNLSKSRILSAAVLEITEKKHKLKSSGQIQIQNSYIEHNSGYENDCFSIFLNEVKEVTVSHVVIQDNNCSGIALDGSRVLLKGSVNVTRNSAKFGGGVYMRHSKRDDQFIGMVLSKTAILSIVNNTASEHGGGIFVDERCKERNSPAACPFQFTVFGKKIRRQLFFSGNNAGIGGDIVSGGCLSNCYVCSSQEKCLVNFLNKSNVFWKLVSSTNEQSASTFAEYPLSVKLCRNEGVEEESITHAQLRKYPGEVFQVAMIVVDELYIPFYEVIQAKITKGGITGKKEILWQSKKNCSEFQFSVTDRAPGKSATINIFMQGQSLAKFNPVQLLVHLQKCPNGFYFPNNGGKCACYPALESSRIGCSSTDYSLKVPSQTWIGNFHGKVAVSQYCLHCNNGKKKTLFSYNSSDSLCMAHRTNIACGACTQNYSLQLGGYHCGKCTDSLQNGILLIFLFVAIGFFLIFTLLSLNLTVSTGMMNALIFYSNIVHFSRENFLPIGTPSEKTFLLYAVKFFSIFQAWVNLDFGVSMCFFDGYDIYISFWLQFIFPAYIWLLIALIVVASRYSSKISRLTSSSTVPVLATLLLLSYTKLLLTSIAAISFTNLYFLDTSSKLTVWLLDGNVSYLKGKHIPLFLFSIVCIVGFILPFTLLILLGPLLQSKSEYKYLHWINKIKPLLDAFYGPYTNQYRYWPGVLILARIALFTGVAFYSQGDVPYTLASIAVMIMFVFVAWIALVRSHSILPYHSKVLNCLEVFFLINLAFFCVVSLYFRSVKSDYLVPQQILAVVMVGTAFLVFCGIVIFQIFYKVNSFNVVKEVKSRFLAQVQLRRGGTDMALREVDVKSDSNSTPPTQSTIELICSPAAKNKLREPLLTN